MVKFVIAGPADCPYFAKIEVLAQTMKSVLPDFDYRPVLVSPKEWNTFVDDICTTNKWNKVRRSPLIWREPLEFGGPKLYFGSFNEFQEYAFAYYGIETTMSGNDMKQLAESNFNSRIKETVVSISTKSDLVVTVIFAKSPLTHYFVPLIANGTIFPDNHLIYVRLFDNSEPESSSLENLAQEIEDMSSPYIKQITVHKKHLSEAVDGAHVVVIFPSKTKLEDLMSEPELKRIGHVIFDWAGYKIYLDMDNLPLPYPVDEVKVLVVYQCVKDTDMNLCNLRMSLTSVLPPENILAITGTLVNRGKTLLAEQMNINSYQISNLLFWGFCAKNNESFIFDIEHATVENCIKSAIFCPNIKNHLTRLIPNNIWLKKNFPKIVAGQVLSNVEESGSGAYNAMSMVNLAANFLKMWWSGSGNDDIYSVCIMSQDWYDVDYGIFFHFPVSFEKPGEYTVITNLSLAWDIQYNIRRIITAYIQHMVEALYERATKVNAYIAALNVDQKNDLTSEYPAGESPSDAILYNNNPESAHLRFGAHSK